MKTRGKEPNIFCVQLYVLLFSDSGQVLRDFLLLLPVRNGHVIKHCMMREPKLRIDSRFEPVISHPCAIIACAKDRVQQVGIHDPSKIQKNRITGGIKYPHTPLGNQHIFRAAFYGSDVQHLSRESLAYAWQADMNVKFWKIGLVRGSLGFNRKHPQTRLFFSFMNHGFGRGLKMYIEARGILQDISFSANERERPFLLFVFAFNTDKVRDRGLSVIVVSTY